MTTSIIDRIKQSANEFSTQLIEIRRHLHTHPELSFEEKETAKFIATQLDKLGITYQKDIGGHGIVGLIKGNNPDQQTIALRADIDALPIHEKNKVSYCSVNE